MAILSYLTTGNLSNTMGEKLGYFVGTSKRNGRIGICITINRRQTKSEAKNRLTVAELCT